MAYLYDSSRIEIVKKTIDGYVIAGQILNAIIVLFSVMQSKCIACVRSCIMCELKTRTSLNAMNLSIYFYFFRLRIVFEMQSYLC